VTEKSTTGEATPAQAANIEPVHAEDEVRREGIWTLRLVWFLRAMAVVSMLKGLYHWGVVIGIGDPTGDNFILHSLPWQAATVFFAVIDLVASVGLWLAAAWGAVVWLTAAVSMAAVEVFFPQIYGGRLVIVLAELAALGCYLWLAWRSASEHPH
jgi:hypothetical protein